MKAPEGAKEFPSLPQFFRAVRERISLVVDLYDAEKYEGSRNYYTPKRPLTAENKLGPPVS